MVWRRESDILKQKYAEKRFKIDFITDDKPSETIAIERWKGTQDGPINIVKIKYDNANGIIKFKWRIQESMNRTYTDKNRKIKIAYTVLDTDVTNCIEKDIDITTHSRPKELHTNERHKKVFHMKDLFMYKHQVFEI